MSRMIKAVRHVGQVAEKFRFEVLIEKLVVDKHSLGEKNLTELSFEWLRGPKRAILKTKISLKNPNIDVFHTFSDETLTLIATLFRPSAHQPFIPKISKLVLVSHNNRKAIPIAHINIDLSQFTTKKAPDYHTLESPITSATFTGNVTLLIASTPLHEKTDGVSLNSGLRSLDSEDFGVLTASDSKVSDSKSESGFRVLDSGSRQFGGEETEKINRLMCQIEELHEALAKSQTNEIELLDDIEKQRVLLNARNCSDSELTQKVEKLETMLREKENVISEIQKESEKKLNSFHLNYAQTIEKLEKEKFQLNKQINHLQQTNQHLKSKLGQEIASNEIQKQIYRKNQENSNLNIKRSNTDNNNTIKSFSNHNNNDNTINNSVNNSMNNVYIPPPRNNELVSLNLSTYRFPAQKEGFVCSPLQPLEFSPSHNKHNIIQNNHINENNYNNINKSNFQYYNNNNTAVTENNKTNPTLNSKNSSTQNTSILEQELINTKIDLAHTKTTHDQEILLFREKLNSMRRQLRAYSSLVASLEVQAEEEKLRSERIGVRSLKQLKSFFRPSRLSRRLSEPLTEFAASDGAKPDI